MSKYAAGIWAAVGAVLLAGCTSEPSPAGSRTDGGGVDSGPDGVVAIDSGPDILSDCTPRTTTAEVLNDFGAAWNERDTTKRDCLLARSFASDGIYLDPITHTSDRPSLSDHIGANIAQSPSSLLAWIGKADLRASDLRAPWSFGTLQTGIDYQELGPDGLIATVNGFWDPFDAGATPKQVDDYVNAWNTPDATGRAPFLGSAVADAVRFRDGTNDVTGARALSDAIDGARSSGLVSASPIKLQSYGTPPAYARLALLLTSINATSFNVTDYLRFDTDGRILRSARFIDGP